MVKKILFISLALFGLLFFTMLGGCFADAAVQLEQAETYKKNEQYEQAEAIYKTVVTDYAGSDYALEAQKNLAILYINRAQAAYERLITDFSRHPALPGALYQVADEYQILQRHEQARQIYQYIVDNFPESDMAVPAQMDVVISNIELGNDAEAKAETKKLIVDFAGRPHLPDVLCGVASKYQGRQRYEQAIELYQYIVDNWPESDRALPAQMDVVISNLELGKDIEAQAATDKLIVDFAGHPDLPDVLYQVANEYQGHQIHEQAQKLYKYIIDNLPESEKVILSRGGLIMADISLGNDANAQAAIGKLILDFNDHPALPGEIYRIASYLYWGEKRYEDARRLYKYIVDNLPESEYVILSRGGVIMADISLGNDANAQAAIDSLIADFSDNPLIARVLWDTAQAYRDLKKYEKANELYQHVIDNWPKAEHAISSQMSVAEINVRSLIESGKDTAAQAALDSLIDDFKGHPDLPGALFEIGEQYYNEACWMVYDGFEGEADYYYIRAISLWERISTEFADSPTTAQASYFAARCSERIGEYNRAIKLYKIVLNDWPDYHSAGIAQYLLSRCYRKLVRAGRISKQEAAPLICQACEKVLANYPDSRVARAAEDILQEWQDPNSL